MSVKGLCITLLSFVLITSACASNANYEGAGGTQDAPIGLPEATGVAVSTISSVPAPTEPGLPTQAPTPTLESSGSESSFEQGANANPLIGAWGGVDSIRGGEVLVQFYSDGTLTISSSSGSGSSDWHTEGPIPYRAISESSLVIDPSVIDPDEEEMVWQTDQTSKNNLTLTIDGEPINLTRMEPIVDLKQRVVGLWYSSTYGFLELADNGVVISWSAYGEPLIYYSVPNSNSIMWSPYDGVFEYYLVNTVSENSLDMTPLSWDAQSTMQLERLEGNRNLAEELVGAWELTEANSEDSGTHINSIEFASDGTLVVNNSDVGKYQILSDSVVNLEYQETEEYFVVLLLDGEEMRAGPFYFDGSNPHTLDQLLPVYRRID